MKKKNGFVFVETMVTIVILATALLAMYTLFTNMLVNEKRRIYYDDPEYMYRANYLVEFLRDRFDFANTYLIEYEPGREYITISDLLVTYHDNSNVPINLYLKAVTCDNDIFDNAIYSSKRDCQKFFYDQRLYRIYVTKADLSYMDYCDNHNDEECFDYRSINYQVKNYMNTLSYAKGADGLYIIFEFNDDGKGNVCTNDSCMHQFASVKYGGTNQVIDLNS